MCSLRFAFPELLPAENDATRELTREFPERVCVCMCVFGEIHRHQVLKTSTIQDYLMLQYLNGSTYEKAF